MLLRRVLAVITSLALLAVLPVSIFDHAVAQAQGGVIYESRPDEVALYLSDVAFARDTIVLPADQGARIMLPPGAYPNTLILKEDGKRVRNYRVTPGTDASATSWNYSELTASYAPVSLTGGSAIVTWESDGVEGAMRTVTLEYLLPGAHWTPSHDMTILDDTPDAAVVDFAFFAEITNDALWLDDATIYLVAGSVGLSRQIDQVPQVTMNQYAVGYSNDTVELPELAVGSVNLQHVYRIGNLDAAPGDRVFALVAENELRGRRMVVWNAAEDQETDVIYKVLNVTDVPLAEGIVRAYQDGLFLGSDFVETTPVGSEGSITVGSLPDVRVHRTASREYVARGNDYYQHEVTLEIGNFGDVPLEIIVLDRWVVTAWEFDFSVEPERQPDNLLRWNVQVGAGSSLVITYRFRTEA